MRTIELLFLDWSLSETKIEEALTLELDLSVINFRMSLREEVENKTELGLELRSVMDSGQLPQNKLLERIVLKQILATRGDLLLTGYPRTSSAFSRLEDLLKKENVSIGKLWFFKQRNPTQFLKDYYDSPKHKPWFEKYGQEVIEVWEKNFVRNRTIVDEIQENTDNFSWSVIELDYVGNICVDSIRDLIKDCA